MWGEREKNKEKKTRRYNETSIAKLFVTFLDVIVFISLRSFQQYQWYHHRSFSVPSRSFFFFYLSCLFTNYKEEREKRNKKKTLKTHQNSDNNTIGIVEKILTRRIRNIWTTCMAYFGHYSWSFLVSLDSFRQYISNDAGCVVIRVLVCLKGLVFSFFISLFFYTWSLLSLL